MINTLTAYIANNQIDIVAASIGLLYLYLEYKASIWMWLASILMAVFFIYIFYTTQLYASMTIYIYFFFASIYGWYAWLRRNRNEETGEHLILRLPRQYILRILILVAVSFSLISAFLHLFSDNTIYLLLGDALTTALNIIAIWMTSRKWAEQWCLLIPANLLSGILLMAQGEIASSMMFYIYFIVSIFGYVNWKKMANKSL